MPETQASQASIFWNSRVSSSSSREYSSNSSSLVRSSVNSATPLPRKKRQPLPNTWAWLTFRSFSCFPTVFSKTCPKSGCQLPEDRGTERTNGRVPRHIIGIGCREARSGRKQVEKPAASVPSTIACRAKHLSRRPLPHVQERLLLQKRRGRFGGNACFAVYSYQINRRSASHSTL
ncbi:hypothetical protein D3C74_329000 [compost metagenome]